MAKVLVLILSFTIILPLAAVLTGLSAEPNGKQDCGVKELVRIRSAEITFYDLSADGNTLAYADVTRPDGATAWTSIVLVNVATGKELTRGPSERGIVHGGLFSADGKILALGSLNYKAYLWDVRKGKKDLTLMHLDTHKAGMPLAFSPDGKHIVGTSSDGDPINGALVLWEAATGKCRTFRWGPAIDYDYGPGFKEAQKLDDSPAFMHARGATFADDGGPFVFVNTGAICQCSIAEMKTLRWPAMGGVSTTHSRFRTAPSGQILALPKYDERPIAFLPYDDGTIALVAIDPAEFVMEKPLPNRKQKELCRLRDFENTTTRSCMLSADGKILVAMGIDPATAKTKNPTSMLIIWDVSKLHAGAAIKMKQLAPADLERFWEHLSQEFLYDPYKAMITLVRFRDQAVPFLAKKLGPPADLPRIATLIKELEHPKFPVRDQSMRELERFGLGAQPFLQKASKEKISEETRARIAQLLRKLQPTAANDELRYLRVIDVLEHINTPPARELLQTIGGGGHGAVYAEAAKAALDRATKRSDKSVEKN